MTGDEITTELFFPSKGIARDRPISEQPPGTTPVGINVRTTEPHTLRARGGSRAGLSKFIDEQVGSGAIQHLNTIVRTDGGALGWEFQRQEFQTTGLYLGLDLASPGSGDSQPTGGGGGYQPSASFVDNRIRCVLTISHTTRDIDLTVTVTATVTDEDGAPVGLKRVRLHTYPGGRDGDTTIGTSAILDGMANITVRSNREETIKYIATVEDALGREETRSRNYVQCVWTDSDRRFVLVYGVAGFETNQWKFTLNGTDFDTVYYPAPAAGFGGKAWRTQSEPLGQPDSYYFGGLITSADHTQISSALFNIPGSNTLTMTRLTAGSVYTAFTIYLSELDDNGLETALIFTDSGFEDSGALSQAVYSFPFTIPP